MSLELTGKVIAILPTETGQGRNGEWKKQSFVIETKGEYPKNACVEFWGNKCDLLNLLAIGQVVKVFFDVNSREHNGKWYTGLQGWKFEAQGVAPKKEKAAEKGQPTLSATEEDDDGLPF